jgi:hypothetical protein
MYSAYGEGGSPRVEVECSAGAMAQSDQGEVTTAL